MTYNVCIALYDENNCAVDDIDVDSFCSEEDAIAFVNDNDFESIIGNTGCPHHTAYVELRTDEDEDGSNDFVDIVYERVLN